MNKLIFTKLQQLKYYRHILTVILALLGTLGFTQLLKFSFTNSTFSTNNFLPMLAFFGLIICYFKPSALSRREQIFTVIASSILAIIMIIGGQLEFYNDIVWQLTTIVKALGAYFFIYPFVSTVISLLNQSKLGNFAPQRKHFFIALGCVFLSTIVIWIILFPGVYTYDMASQNEQISLGIITSHWSLLYGYLFAGFLDLGKAIFGNFEAGMAIAMFVQACFVCYVEARIVTFASRLSHSKLIYILSIIFFSLIPFFGTIAVSSAQDVLFTGLFALLTINLAEISLNVKTNISPFTLTKIVALSLLMCAVRNNGVYCLIILLLFVAIFYKRPRKTLFLALVGTVIVYFIYSRPILNIFHVQKSTAIQEISSIPSQQLARAYFANPDSFNTDELSSLKDYYDLNAGFELYPQYPLISDFTKASLRPEVVSKDLGGYISLWAKIGLKNPGNYVEAFLLNSIGYWYPNKNYNDPRINLDFMNYPGFVMTAAFLTPDHPAMKPVTAQTISPSLTHQLEKFVFGGGWMEVPLISTICSIGTYGLLLLFTIGYVIMRQKYNLLLPLSLVFGLYLTLLLSPVAIFRYAYPVVILAPVFIGLILYVTHTPNTYKAQTAVGASLPRRSKSRQ